MPQGHLLTSPNGTTLNRRVLLQGGLALASATALGVAGAPWLTPLGAGLRYYKVLFDRDHPAAHAFGKTMAASGLVAKAIDRDMTRVWYDDLYHRWRLAPVAIAGMTPVNTAFCLQIFAQDVGMRMVYRAEHRPLSDGRLQHRISAPAPLVAQCGSLDVGGDWPHAAARLVMACPAALKGRRSVVATTSHASGFAYGEALVSWVIAPVKRT